MIDTQRHRPLETPAKTKSKPRPSTRPSKSSRPWSTPWESRPGHPDPAVPALYDPVWFGRTQPLSRATISSSPSGRPATATTRSPGGPPLFKGRLFFQPPTRGDIIVFKLPSDGHTDYIKRLIGMPGDPRPGAARPGLHQRQGPASEDRGRRSGGGEPRFVDADPVVIPATLTRETNPEGRQIS